MAKNVVLSVEDVPTKLQLMHAASRLRKCFTLLSRIRGTNDVEDPKSLIATANFLDMLAKRESRSLRKEGEETTDAYVKASQREAVERMVNLVKSMRKDDLMEHIRAAREDPVFEAFMEAIKND